MAKKKPGRKKLPENDRVKLMTAYLKESEQKLIKRKYKNLTTAVRDLVLPECG